LDDSETVLYEVAGLLGERETCVGQAEDPYVAVQERLALSRSSTDVVVLAKNDPVSFGGQRIPFSVLDPLGSLLSVDVSQRSHPEADFTQSHWQRYLAETAIDQELRRLFVALPTG